MRYLKELISKEGIRMHIYLIESIHNYVSCLLEIIDNGK